MAKKMLKISLSSTLSHSNEVEQKISLCKITESHQLVSIDLNRICWRVVMSWQSIVLNVRMLSIRKQCLYLDKNYS